MSDTHVSKPNDQDPVPEKDAKADAVEGGKDVQDSDAPDRDAPTSKAQDGDAPESARSENKDPTSPKQPKRRHMRRFAIWMGSLSFLIAFLVALTILALTGRDIVLPSKLSTYFEEKISRDLGDAKVNIGQVVVNVDKDFIPHIRARNVSIIDPTGSELARLNELQAQFSFSQLKTRQFTPRRLLVSGAQIVLRRRVDGSFALDFGGAAGTVGSSEQVLQAIDTVFSTAPFNAVESVQARELTISLEDARSNRIWSGTNASVTLRNTSDSIDISTDLDVFNGTENLAELQVSMVTRKRSLATTISLNMSDVPALDVAQQSPALSFLSVLDAPISAAMRAKVNGSGILTSYAGTLEIGSGQLVAGDEAQPLNFDGAKGYFSYDPIAERLSFSEVSLRTDAYDVAGTGHILLRDFDGIFPSKFEGQFSIDRLSADPRDVFAAPIVFDQGAVDLQLQLNPFSIDVGQIALRRGDLWLRGAGRGNVTDQGWNAAFDAQIDQMHVDDLMSLWPEAVIPKTRVWIKENITEAKFENVNLALRLPAGATQPQTHLAWEFDDANVRFMKTLPPVENGAGYGEISGNALTVVVQDGAVTAATGGAVDVTDTVLRIPQLDIKPATLDVQIQTSSTVEAALSLVEQKPFFALKNAAFGPDVSQGQAQLYGQISLPLIKKLTLEDVDFNISGDLTDLKSDQLMKGQELRSPRMVLALDSTGLSLTGRVDVDQARAQAEWRKDFGADNRGRSRISGEVTINQALLDVFGISLPRDTIDGAAQGRMDVALQLGQDPAFDISSDLEGLSLSLPAIGYSKLKDWSGDFRITGTAGAQPKVTDLSLSFAGLSAENGSVTLKPDGGLDRLRFDDVQVGAWLDSSVTLLGRGKGKPVSVQVKGGRLSLHKSPLAQVSGGASTQSSGPIEIVLDQLDVTKDLSLKGFQAQLSDQNGLAGSYSGRLNGTAPVTGTVTTGPDGPIITVKAKDAGKVVVAAKLLEEASGGTFDMTLTALPAPQSYSGFARIKDIKIQSAPELAELLSLVSVVGLLEQMSGPGIGFSEIESAFTITPKSILIGTTNAQGPSLGITAEGRYQIASQVIDLQGVISPIYFLNGIGQIFSRKGEGLFGFNFSLRGPIDNPAIGVNPLSILTPGALRGIFRASPQPAPAPAAPTN
ncbi:AsmA-like protein [Pacificibacter maritimus]|uniref:AsmA-like protein n=1 Tax=Pacificibacter maritimus TaxID=762213 RepID=A0A3N4VBK0_9RHOB|nr:DUF3971 domain-containing protein [Pacificibacter maritimus]RPE71210.1 AsmA-like protein [Pacificibacter maritimus]